ncbi:MAG: hypothetical protein HYS32_00775 [Candidatus Woesearchaeota archaeon]|nr:MAG: hypothetical protein HYS32_00775 [Candidatus Woesearchaeota archaeon]
MKRVIVLLLIFVLSFNVVYAAGGGGGGSSNIKSKSDSVQEAVVQELNASDTGEGLLCGDLATRTERVKCRLNLVEEEYEREYRLQYLPEECRALQGGEKGKCISTYKSVQTCWTHKETGEGVGCVMKQINFRGISEERRICNELNGDAKKECADKLKENIFTVIKFRFYNLEERAEEFLEEGKIAEEEVIVFIDAIEGKKVEFNSVSDIEGKKRIVMEVKDLWQEFLGKVQ